MSTYLGMIDSRIQRLQRQQGRRAGFVSGPDWYALKVSPSSPPGKTVLLRGGQAAVSSSDAFSAYTQRVYTIPSLTVNLADPTLVGVDITFANAGYYLAYVLDLAPPAVVASPTTADWTFVLVGSGTEFVTAAEAEADMEEYALWRERPWAEGAVWKGYPLCGLVLRNDGTVGPGCQILAVDQVNRGRSYLWPADVRPRWAESW